MPVTNRTRRRVLERDRGCVAPVLDSSQSGRCSGALTLDHVKCQPMMAKKAPDDEQHLVVVCARHHGLLGGDSWATSNRPTLRAYLDAIYGKEARCERCHRPR